MLPLLPLLPLLRLLRLLRRNACRATCDPCYSEYPSGYLRRFIEANSLEPYVAAIPDECILIAPAQPRPPGVFFSGSISGNMMSVGLVHQDGRILIGGQVHGCCVADGTTVKYQISPSDGPQGRGGVYWVEPQQTVASATLEIFPPPAPGSQSVVGDDDPITSRDEAANR